MWCDKGMLGPVDFVIEYRSIALHCRIARNMKLIARALFFDQQYKVWEGEIAIALFIIPLASNEEMPGTVTPSHQLPTQCLLLNSLLACLRTFACSQQERSTVAGEGLLPSSGIWPSYLEKWIPYSIPNWCTVHLSESCTYLGFLGLLPFVIFLCETDDFFQLPEYVNIKKKYFYFIYTLLLLKI